MESGEVWFVEIEFGNFYQSISVALLGGSKKQDWEGSFLSKLGKGSEIVLFRKGFLLI